MVQVQKRSHTFMAVVAVAAVFTSTFSSLSFASDESVTAGLKAARALYQQRSATNLASVIKAYEILNALEKDEEKAEDPELNYQVLVEEARMLYFQGVHQEGVTDKGYAAKLKFHVDGQAKADEAIQLVDVYADAYYLAGINLARWGEAKGVVYAGVQAPNLKAYMKAIIDNSKPTISGKPGVEIDGYGPNRVLGRVSFKLPGFLGGSRTESLEYLKVTYEKAKNLALNVIYYADTLYAGNGDEKLKAKKVLDELLANDPLTYNADRIPETIEEFEIAKKNRETMK